MNKDIHLTYWVKSNVLYHRIGGESIGSAISTGSTPLRDLTVEAVLAHLTEVFKPTSVENLDATPKKKYDHAYELGFSVVTEDEEGGATQAQLCEAIQRRLNDLITNNELVEACGLPYDSEEM